MAKRNSEAGEDRTRRLPPGPHGIPPELVGRNQRERLIAAMAEVCAERGYAGSSVADVAKRAGVSTASFYRQFKDRRECMLASFEELFGRLLEQIEGACGGEAEPAARARAGAGAAATLLAGDPPTARLLSIEVLAVGPEGVRLQHEAIERLAARLREPDEAPPGQLPDPAWAAVAAIVALVGKRVAEGESPEPAELEALCALP
ncbi:MAG TPA: TetR/AcrR family transcriptional regulator [Solirubrobacterales bacterium]|nr:TetR/AcrR family transcriptional regulator [Solirubrobacterales bacterium]